MNQSITIYNMNNQALTVDVVRYFRMNGNRYAIVTLREQDEQGYVKLYVVKIFEENGTLASMNVVDETEWASVKEIIKEIIKNVKENQPVSVEDLDYNKLQGIKLGDNRVFKLLSNLVSMLSANINVVEEVPEESVGSSASEEVQLASAVDESVSSVDGDNGSVMSGSSTVSVPEGNSEAVETPDYKQLYFAEVSKNKKLQEKLDTIKTLIG